MCSYDGHYGVFSLWQCSVTMHRIHSGSHSFRFCRNVLAAAWWMVSDIIHCDGLCPSIGPSYDERILWESRKELNRSDMMECCLHSTYTYTLYPYLYHHKLCYQSLTNLLWKKWTKKVIHFLLLLHIYYYYDCYHYNAYHYQSAVNEAQLSNVCCAQPAILIFRFYHQMIHTTANNRHPVIALKWTAIILYSGRDRWRWSFLLASSFFFLKKEFFPLRFHFLYISRIFLW